MKPKPIFDIFSRKHEVVKQEEKFEVLVDYRERNSLVPSELIRLGAEIKIQELKVADYIAKGVAIERKTIPDFLNSMINKRLFSQLEEIQQYPQKLLIIEGENLLSNTGGINPNAVRGFLLSIATKFNVPLIFTKNSEETAQYIFLLAKKQEKDFSINAKKRNLTPKEQKHFILEGFSGIGPTTAKELLEKFKTLKNIFNSSEEELKEILGKKSEDFKKLLDEEY